MGKSCVTPVKGETIYHLVCGIAEDFREVDRGGSNGLAVGANGHMNLHHHFCVVQEFKEVVFKLHLDANLVESFFLQALSSPCSMSSSQILPQALPSLECTTDKEIMLD